MALFDPGCSPEKLEQLLARERAAILAGDFSALSRISVEKERLVARLDPLAPDTAQIARLRRMSGRNGRLLEAARLGLSDARRKLASLGAPPELHTYDSAGRRTTLSPRPKALTKRG